MFARYEEGSPSEAAAQEENSPIAKRVKREPIKVGGNVQESKLIRRVEPVYPESAKRARVQGKVVLVVTVDEEGSVPKSKLITVILCCMKPWLRPSGSGSTLRHY
jgi:outer membrane biosynthesis protein TonB